MGHHVHLVTMQNEIDLSMDGLVAKGRNNTFTGHSYHLIHMEGCNWFVGYIIHDHMASMSLINKETPEEAHGTANLEISLSLITSITRYRVGVPRITGHSVMPGSSITMAILSSSYPWTLGTLMFIMMNPMGSTEMLPRPLMSGMDPPISCDK